MNAREVARHLRTLGVNEQLVDLYRLVVDLEPCATAELAAAAGRPVEEGLAGLTDLGLVHSPDDGQVRAAFPGTALQQLASRRSAEVDLAHLSVLEWVSSRRRVDPVGALASVVEVVRARDVAEHVSHLERRAQQQVRLFDTPPYFRRDDGWPVERENLGRGVAYRVVYATASLDRPAALTDLVAPCIRAGEQARATARLPLKLMIIDEHVAVIGTAERDDDRQPVMVIQPSSLLDGLIELFESTWRSALALDTLGGRAAPSLTPDERRLLTLLATGSSDEQVARVMGISKRTFFRRLQRLMDGSGARSRFQLAVLAARHDWV